MPQTSVYIPDSLWERVKQWRDRELINVSAVCQRALQSEVRRLDMTQEESRNFDERAAAAGIDIDMLAARIRRRKSEAFQVGYDALLEWAQSASFADLLAERGDVTFDNYGEPFPNPMPESGGEIAQRLGEERGIPYDHDMVYPGWRDGAKNLWSRLDEKTQEAAPQEPEFNVDDIPF